MPRIKSRIEVFMMDRPLEYRLTAVRIWKRVNRQQVVQYYPQSVVRFTLTPCSTFPVRMTVTDYYRNCTVSRRLSTMPQQQRLLTTYITDFRPLIEPKWSLLPVNAPNALRHSTALEAHDEHRATFGQDVSKNREILAAEFHGYDRSAQLAGSFRTKY